MYPHRQLGMWKISGAWLAGVVCVLLALLGYGGPALAVPLGDDFLANTSSNAPYPPVKVARARSGAFVVTWYNSGLDGDTYGVFARRFNTDGSAAGPEFQANTYTASWQYLPDVAMDGVGNFVIVWTSRGQDGSGDGIYAQRFDSQGQPVGNEFRVNTFTTRIQMRPAVAMNSSGAFVVAWEDTRNYEQDVYAQRFDEEGNPVGSEFEVNTYQANTQWYPAVAMNDAGQFVVAWESNAQDGYSYGIYAQPYDEEGLPVGGELRANVYTADSEARCAVAIDRAGDFVVVWMANNQDGDGAGVYGRRFDATGAPEGDEFLVNTTVTGGQQYPAVAMNGAGDFVVTWFGPVVGAFGSDVFGRLYTRAGEASGEEFVVNSNRSSSQNYPDIAMDGSSNFVVVWKGYLGAEGRLFTADHVLPMHAWPVAIFLLLSALVAIRQQGRKRRWRR